MTFNDLRSELIDERGGTAGSWPWTERFLETASAEFGDAWTSIEISGSEARKIVLPPHAGEPCRGDRLGLVPPGGATVLDAGEALRAMRDDYERDNPECWSRIIAAAISPFSTIVLTPRPIAMEPHSGVSGSPGTLFHLDGFHRLVAWMWAGRLTPAVTFRAVVPEGAGR